MDANKVMSDLAAEIDRIKSSEVDEFKKSFDDMDGSVHDVINDKFMIN